MKYRPHEFGELAGVSVKTLQRWDKSGKLKADRTLGNCRYYTDKHLSFVRGIRPSTRKTVIYARVSSSPQKPELENQVTAMEAFCTSRGVKVDEVVREIGGGLNFKRKKFTKLLEQVLSGQVSIVYVAHKDRLCRFAFELVEWLCELNGTKIVVANNESLSPQQEMVEDLMAIIHCFSCRLYGLRNYAKVIKDNVDKNMDSSLECKNDIQC